MVKRNSRRNQSRKQNNNRRNQSRKQNNNRRNQSRKQNNNRRNQLGGFIRAPSAQYSEHCGGPNPSKVEINTNNCVSCAQKGGRNSRHRISRRQLKY